jgi:hypothetical protein
LAELFFTNGPHKWLQNNVKRAVIQNCYMRIDFIL